jgi:hypothetical protein
MRLIIALTLATISWSAIAQGGAPILVSQACEVPKDCKGSLPRHCVVCPDGKGSKCAHWACVEQKCKIATCEDAAPAAGQPAGQ